MTKESSEIDVKYLKTVNKSPVFLFCSKLESRTDELLEKLHLDSLEPNELTELFLLTFKVVTSLIHYLI